MEFFYIFCGVGFFFYVDDGWVYFDLVNNVCYVGYSYFCVVCVLWD